MKAFDAENVHVTWWQHGKELDMSCAEIEDAAPQVPGAAFQGIHIQPPTGLNVATKSKIENWKLKNGRIPKSSRS